MYLLINNYQQWKHAIFVFEHKSDLLITKLNSFTM